MYPPPQPDRENAAMADDPALVCLALVARFHGVAAEPCPLPISILNLYPEA